MNDSYYREIFSKNLKYYMNLRNKKQVDLVTDLKFSKAVVSSWVTGIRLPRMDKVDALAKYLEVNRSDLIEERKTEDKETVDEVARALELYEKYKQSIPEIQAAVDGLLKPARHDP